MDPSALTPQSIFEKLTPVFVKNAVHSAVLFGSAARGTARPDSDIDLLVDSGLCGLRFFGLVGEICDVLDGIEADVFDVTQLEPDGALAKEIAATGILIYTDGTEIFHKYKLDTCDAPARQDEAAILAHRLEKERRLLASLSDHTARVLPLLDAEKTEFSEETLLLRLLRIGLCAEKLLPETLAELPALPWEQLREISGACSLITSDLPTLRKQLAQLQQKLTTKG